jgi:membrane protein implicated in regulation of membrane protease activity
MAAVRKTSKKKAPVKKQKTGRAPFIRQFLFRTLIGRFLSVIFIIAAGTALIALIAGSDYALFFILLGLFFVVIIAVSIVLFALVYERAKEKDSPRQVRRSRR